MKGVLALAFAALLSAAAERKATATFRIEGMTCDGCASAVEVQLGQTEGVKGYAVSFEDAEARVSYDPERTTPEKIAASIGLTGFRAFVKSGPPKAQVTVLSDSLAPLVSDFNAAQGKPRFLAILSPTCGDCVHGARAVREALLRDSPAPSLELFVVWGPMLQGDDEAAAKGASALVKHDRVRQYYDPGRRAGAAFRSDVPEGDIYLFFDAAAEWTTRPPLAARFVRVNDYAQSPRKGRLVDELRKEAAALLER